MSILRLKIRYEWAGLEELCLPQADKVMEALLATDDRGPNNMPRVSMGVKILSGRSRAPDRSYENPQPLLIVGDPKDRSTWMVEETGETFDENTHIIRGGILVLPPEVARDA